MGQKKDMDHKKMVPFLGKEGPFGDTGPYFRLEELVGSPNESSSDEGSEGAGGLAIVAMREPTVVSFDSGLSGIDRYLHLRLNGDEWVALYRQALRCPDAGQLPRLPNEDLEEWSKRYAAQFRQAMPAQPMLARIYDRFNYVTYAPDEIEQLRVECVELEANILNEKARFGLKKLIAACDEALRLRVGLLFVPD